MGNIKSFTKLFYFYIIAIALFLPLGCNTTHPVAPSGFLKDYSALKPLPEDHKVLYYEKPDVKWNTYKKLLVDPITVYYHPDAVNRNIQPDELKKLTDYFYDEIIKALGDAYPVVDDPGQDVLRVRVAITDIIPTNTVVNLVTAAAVLMPLNMGGASMEAELLDSVSNERLAAIIDRRKGTPLNVVQGFTKWSHAKGAFRYWAHELRKALDDVN